MHGQASVEMAAVQRRNQRAQRGGGIVIYGDFAYIGQQWQIVGIAQRGGYHGLAQGMQCPRQRDLAGEQMPVAGKQQNAVISGCLRREAGDFILVRILAAHG